jgi:hypothetical protein
LCADEINLQGCVGLAVRWVERDNVNYPLNLAGVESSTAEDVATRWQKIAANVVF